MLEDIFFEYNGCFDVRTIPDKGYAFIEFENDDLAAMALQNVRDLHQLVFDDPETGLKVEARINYGKR